MFQDFIQGTNYCSHFSPYTKESYADNLKKLQTRLAYYEILREANYRNLELAQHLNYIALWLGILSYSFFYLGLQGFSFTSALHGFEPRSRRGRKENASVTQSGTRFPDGSPGGKHVPESTLRLGRSFRMTPQTETASRNPHSEWDAISK